MSSNLVGMSKYASSSNAASRSSVVMSAATISGDGAFESQGENYMDQLDEMKGAAVNRLKKAKNARSSVIMSASATDYSTEIDSFLENRPATTAKIDNVTEKGDVPNNTYKPKEPLVGKVVFNTTLTGPDAGEVCHIVFDHEGKLPYAEGQSIGIVANGTDKNGKLHKIRLYSIASSAPGDYGDGKTVSLCVKRLIYEDPETGEEVKGVCSNFICDLKAGDEVQITGPVGKALLLPKDQKANVIMLATGTGIAPFRSFLWRFFMEQHPDYKYDGNAWLFLGVPTTSALLYDAEFKKMKEIGGDRFKYDYAISREQTNEAGDKMYIQTRMAEYGEELWNKMQEPDTYVYMCGLKGMEKGIQEALGGFAEKNGVEWGDFVKKMKKEGRYHVEVY